MFLAGLLADLPSYVFLSHCLNKDLLDYNKARTISIQKGGARKQKTRRLHQRTISLYCQGEASMHIDKNDIPDKKIHAQLHKGDLETQGHIEIF